MGLENCPACNKQYESGRSLRAHQRGPCGVALKVQLRKQQKRRKKAADDALIEFREDLREEVDPFDADDAVNGAKRKLREGTVSF